MMPNKPAASRKRAKHIQDNVNVKMMKKEEEEEEEEPLVEP